MTPRASLRSHLLAATAGFVLLAAGEARANPTGGQVVGGAATITGQGQPVTTINQTSNRAIINWTDFSNAAGEAVVFHQPSANSATLNRVTGPNASVLLGQVQANGQIYLINSRGVLFGKGSTVNTAGLVVSTAGIGNASFMAGTQTTRFDQPGAADAAIVNSGTITVADAGIAAFVAPQVVNTGVITARYGRVALGAGTAFTLDLTGDGLISFLPGDTVKTGPSRGGALVQAGGEILADSGSVLLTAAAARQVINQSVSVTGLVSATEAVVGADGSVRLGGRRTRLSAGNVTVKATGDVSLGPGARIDVSSTAARGGSVTITGANIALNGARIDANGAMGGGVVQIGGGARGQGPLAHARTVSTDAATTITADATQAGDGGHIVLWSDKATAFGGGFSALGGLGGGNGGLIETSSKLDLTVLGHASAYARSLSGKAGEWLLDPADITIAASADTGVSEPAGGTWVSTGSSGTINAATIQTALNAGTSVSIATSGSGSGTGGSGNITVNSGVTIAKTAGGDATLTLTADKNLTFKSGVSITSTTGKLGMSFTATSGVIAMTTPTLTTNGGNLTISALSPPTPTSNYNAAVTFTNGATLNVGTGTGTITGKNPNEVNPGKQSAGVEFFGGAPVLTASGGGSLTVVGSGDKGIGFDNGTSVTTNGTVNIQGTDPGGNTASYGIQFFESVINTGTLTVVGAGTAAGAVGVGFYSPVSNSGVLSVTGTSNGNVAVGLGTTFQNTSTNANASITVTGTSTNQALSFGSAQLINSAANGTIRVTGNGPSYVSGTFTNQNTALDSNGVPALTVTATNTGAALRVTGNITATGAVTLSGANTSLTDGSSAVDLPFGGSATLAHKNVGTTASSLNIIGNSNKGSGIGLGGSFTVTGAVNLTGTSSTSAGVLLNGLWTINNATLTADAGDLTVSGTSTSGLGLTTYGGGVTNNSSRSVTLNGTSASLTGLYAYGSTYANTSTGSLSLNGTSSSGTGVVLGNTSSVLTLNGTQTITGTSASSDGVSLAMGATAASELALGATAAVTINGARSTPSNGTNDISVATAGGLIAGTTGASLTLNGTTPSGSANSGTISLNGLIATSLSQLNLSATPVGVGVAGNLTVTGNLTASGASVGLSATGSVTDLNTITATSVSASAATGVTLSNTSNSFATFAGTNTGAGTLSVYDNAALTIGTVGALSGVSDTSGAISLVSTGQLAVTASVQSGSSSAAAVVLAAGDGAAVGNTINGDVRISGASTAVSTGSGGGAVVYTGSISNTALDGLGVAGQYRYGSTRTTTNYTAALGSGLNVIYRQQPTLTTALSVAGADSHNAVTYNGAAYAPVLSVTGGAVNGDAPTVTATLGPSSQTHAGTYSATASGLSSALGYAVAAPATLTWTINPITLAFSGLSVTTKTYDGTNTAYFTGTPTATNVLSADQSHLIVTSAPSGTYDTVHAGSGKTVTVAGSSFSLSGSASGDYQVQNFTLTGAISQAFLSVASNPLNPLTVTSKTYDGTATATVTGAGVLSGTVYGGDSVSLVQGTLGGTFSTIHAGTQGVTVSGFSLSNADYQLNPVVLSGVITPRQITLSGISVADKVYDGGLTATLQGAPGQDLAASATLNNVLAADAGKVTVHSLDSLTAAFADKNAGQGKAVTVTAPLVGGTSALALDGTAAADYVLAPLSLTGNITQATLTVASGISAVSRPYDGTAAVTLQGTPVLSGLIGSDSVTLNWANMTGALTNVHVQTTGNTATVNGITYSGADAGNYALVVNPVAVTLTKRMLNVTGLTASDKTYDGTATASLVIQDGSQTATVASTGAQISSTSAGHTVLAADAGLIGLNMAGTLTAQFADVGGVSGTGKNAGTGKSVTVGGLSLVGTSQPLLDYGLNAPVLTATIAQKALQVSGLASGSRAYDGTDTAPLTGTASLSGVITGDSVTTQGSWSGTFAGHVDVGANLPVSLTAPNLTGADAANYVIQAPSLTGAITPKSLTVSNLAVTSRVYDAGTDATVTGAALLNGVINNEVTLDPTAAAAALANAAFATASAGTGKAVTVSGFTLAGSATKIADYTISPVTLYGDIARLAVSVTGVTVAPKTYDGTTVAGVTVTTPGLGGVLSADLGKVWLQSSGSVSGAFQDPNAGIGKTLTLTGLSLQGASAADYVLNPVTGVINPATVYVRYLKGMDKVYDGTTAAALDPTAPPSLDGVIAADARTVGLSLTNAVAAFQGTGDVGARKPLTVTGLALTNNSLGNYTLVQPTDVTATITPATLTLGGNLTAESRPYNGASTTRIDGTLTVTGVVAADQAAFRYDASQIYGAFADPNAGSGKAVTRHGFSFSGAPSQDYVVSAPTLTADITKAVLTVGGLSVATKAYDGTTTALLDASRETVQGAVNGESVGVNLTFATAAFNSADVGHAPGGAVAAVGVTVNMSTVQLTGTASANYQVSPIVLTGLITPKAVSVTGLMAASRAYDGTTLATIGVDPSAGAVALDGVLLADARAVSLAIAAGGPTGQFATQHAGAGLAVSVGGLSLGGLKSGDYSLTPLTLYADITKAIVTATGYSIATRTYDTTTTVPIVTAASAGLTGVIAGDDVSLSGAASATYADAHAGTAKTVTVQGLSIGGASVADYQLAPLVLTGIVTPAPVSVTGLAASSRAYDGSTAATVSGTPGYAGVFASDLGRVQLDGAAVGAFADPHAGAGKTVTVSGLQLTDLRTGAADGDYVLAYPTLSADITPATVRLSGLTATGKVYDGLTTATLTGTAGLQGVVAADQATLQLLGVAAGRFSDPNAGLAKPVSVTGLSLGGASAADYVLGGTTLAASITPATLTFTANPAQRGYGGLNPPFSGTVSGFVNGETQASATTGTLSFISPATPASAIGAFAINGGGLTANNDNYQFVQAPGNATAFTISPPFTGATIGLTTALVPGASAVSDAPAAGPAFDLRTAPTGSEPHDRRDLVCSDTGGAAAQCAPVARSGR